MKTKSVEQVIAPPAPHFVGDGFRVHNFIPGAFPMGMHRMDPFIMLDYNSKVQFAPSEKPRGVGVHPHRGFETVTIAYKGMVEHGDSAGNSGVIGEGDVQWMTAASGILHKEFHEREFSKAGGDFQMVQLWVNLPAKYKMSQPKYQGLTHSQLGKYELPGNGGVVEVIAGEYGGVNGAASTFTPMHLLNVRLKKGAVANFSFPAHYHTGALAVEGSLRVNDTHTVPTDHFVLFKNEGEEIRMEAATDSIVLLLSGEPIREPIAAQGPFVMNTREELVEAIQDYSRGKFGQLED